MKNKVLKNIFVAIMLAAAGTPAFGQFSKTAYDSDAGTTATAKEIQTGEVSANATNPGGPGDPDLPIDGITGVLIATGAAIILAAGRKRVVSRL